MRYKVINNNTQLSRNTRADYLHQKFCVDKRLDPKAFVHKVKSAYYMYDSEVYSPNYTATLSNVFSDLFSELSFKALPAVIDIGAGTGQSYELVKSTNLEFDKYYFIEPFKSMIDKFNGKNDDRIFLVCDYFESSACAALLSSETRPKIFLMCASLRTLDNLPEFIDSLKKYMNVNDRLILPVEPNNEYFGVYFKLLAPLILGARIVKKFQSFFNSKRHNLQNSMSGKSAIDMALEHLKKTSVVSADFTTGMLYAIVYYNNFYTWRKISVPDQYNEGFFTIGQVADRLGGKVSKLRTHTYLYGFSFGFKKLDDVIERILSKVLPRKGAVLSAVITKK